MLYYKIILIFCQIIHPLFLFIQIVPRGTFFVFKKCLYKGSFTEEDLETNLFLLFWESTYVKSAALMLIVPRGTILKNLPDQEQESKKTEEP